MFHQKEQFYQKGKLTAREIKAITDSFDEIVVSRDEEYGDVKDYYLSENNNFDDSEVYDEEGNIAFVKVEGIEFAETTDEQTIEIPKNDDK